jgi:hypothetical protein
MCYFPSSTVKAIDSAKVDLADDCTQFLDTATEGVRLASVEEDGKADHAIGPFARAYDR